MTAVAYTVQQRRNLRAKYDRLYKSPHPSGLKTAHVTVPADVERVEDSWPCGYCGVRAGVPCRHKPWMLAQ